MNPLNLTNIEQLNSPDWVAAFNSERQERSRQANGPVIEFVTATGLNVVKHDLGRVPTEFYVASTEGAINISKNVKAWDSTYAYLDASADNVLVKVRFT